MVIHGGGEEWELEAWKADVLVDAENVSLVSVIVLGECWGEVELVHKLTSGVGKVVGEIPRCVE